MHNIVGINTNEHRVPFLAMSSQTGGIHLTPSYVHILQLNTSWCLQYVHIVIQEQNYSVCYHHNCIVLAQITMYRISIRQLFWYKEAACQQHEIVWTSQIAPPKLANGHQCTCHYWNATVFIKVSYFLFDLIKTWDSPPAQKQFLHYGNCIR